MNYQINYIGKKIKQNSKILAGKTAEVPKGDMVCSLLNVKLTDRRCLLEELFYYLGEYLSTDHIEVRNSIASWADLFGQRSIHSEISLDLSCQFIYIVRSSIMELIEEEVTSQRLSTKALFQLTRELDSLFQLVTNTITELYIDSFSTTKFALNESAEDLSITLKELADLKNALNEATIFAITDKNDEIAYVNEKFCDISKYTKAELIGQKHHILNSGFHPSSFFEDIWHTIQEGKVWKGEILNQAKDGTCYWVDTTIVPFINRSGETYQHISIQYDITEQKKTEEILRKAEKLSLVGELAAGIAHEIRNPLTTIKGFVQLLRKSHEETKLLYADTILEEIDRINFIVSEFMVFAKPHANYYTECDVCEILQSVIKLLEAEAALKDVILHHEIPQIRKKIRGEKNQLKQVFLNIIKNGIEALPLGGQVRINAHNTHSEMVITIQDNGVGMNENQIHKLGEPFYTTKPSGNGLGLMVSYKIIQNHNGNIRVKSEVNQGTIFQLSFPLIR
ncbi:PAS domain S-box-containing protein [Peribacillus deserti]|uniref:histidine kinase n=1 Tax=Peribacillus deserti TaxID=673318 RepID=A0ABS2QM55_9BACI|nr:ATP-binding protein [Peribacillus deserti]MBM7694246.1 PAS domain S-box-containing protein [Peribacillus deserti]